VPNFDQLGRQGFPRLSIAFDLVVTAETHGREGAVLGQGEDARRVTGAVSRQ